MIFQATGGFLATFCYSYLANASLVGQIGYTNNGTGRMIATRQHDNLGRLTPISNSPLGGGGPVSHGYSYNSAGQRTRRTEADGSSWTYRYDGLGQVTSGKRYWADWTPVAGQQFEYAFDEIGNRTATKAGGDENGMNLRSATYGANALNQYTNRTVPGAVDVMGIVLGTNTVTVNGQAPYRKGEYFRKELALDNSGGPVWQAVTVAAPGEGSVNRNEYVARTPEVFGYDPDGNLTNDGRWSYTWDGENRLVRMEPSGTVAVPNAAKCKLEFGYDWRGRRVSKTACWWTNSAWLVTVSNRFVYDGWNLVAEVNATNQNVIRSYLWGLDLSGSPQGAGGVGGLLAVKDTAAGTHFAAFDGNGNVTALAAASDSAITARYEYGPFGELIRQTGPMAKVNPFRFSTKYTDDETDLLYYGYRYYNPSTGRWISRDPIEEAGGVNLYGFVGNNPISIFDVLGMEWKGYDKRDSSKSRVEVTCDCDDTVKDLATLIELEPKEYVRWLSATDGKGLPASETAKIGGKRKFSIPNEAHITQGDLQWRGGSLTSMLRNKKNQIADVYKKKGYKVVDHYTDDADGQDFDEIKGIVDSADIYVWAHFGHGRAGKIRIAKNAGQAAFASYAAKDFRYYHHRLSEVVVYSCQAGQGDWLDLVAKGGSLYATSDVIFQIGVDLNFFKKGDDYYPLVETKK